MKIRSIISALTLVITVGVFLTSLAHGGELRRTILQVSNMRCSSCLRVLEAELRKVPGVVGMTAVFREGQVVVDHGVEVAAAEIAAVVATLGYPAAVAASSVVTEKEANRFQRAGFGGGPGFCNPGGASPVAESWKELRRRFFRKGTQVPQGK